MSRERPPGGYRSAGAERRHPGAGCRHPGPGTKRRAGAARPGRNAGAHGRTYPDPGTGSHRNGHPPVPTVTPTATPEPTEQPEKMYAAKSVDNVQAVSKTGVPDTYTLYFAVPNGWENYKKVKIYAIVGKNGSVNGDKKYYLEMQLADETEDGRKIYSAVLNKDDHYPYNGLGGLEFRGYENDAIADEAPTSTIIIVQVDNNNQLQDMSFNPTASNYIGGNYYDGNNGNGNKGNSWDQTKWKDYTVSHKHFAKKAMAFENKKTSATLTNVKAWFYEPDKEGTLIQVDEQPISLNDIQPGTTATFKIPDAFCSFVRFTAGDNDTEEISEYYNFYNEKVTGEKQKSFQYSEGQCYCYMYNGIEGATWGRPGATRIYYDAIFFQDGIEWRYQRLFNPQSQ